MDLELINQLHSEINYKDLEKAEVVYKQELISLAKNKDYQKLLDLSYKVGFLFKQKAYGVKCSLPTGYSLFLLNQNEGFSYQRHESFKIELFHFFRPDQTTFCYLAPYNKFLETSSKQNLEAFHVNKKGAHDRHCIKPKTGDVVIVKNIGDIPILAAICSIPGNPFSKLSSIILSASKMFFWSLLDNLKCRSEIFSLLSFSIK
jgi:hypothetical protein